MSPFEFLAALFAASLAGAALSAALFRLIWGGDDDA
jgi:hypothetical protein